jgi:hypothetical protein
VGDVEDELVRLEPCVGNRDRFLAVADLGGELRSRALDVERERQLASRTVEPRAPGPDLEIRVRALDTAV